MFKLLLNPLRAELSGSRAFQHVEQLSSHHRIQASPGFRQAAEYAACALRKAGLTSQVVSYPANEATQFWSQRMWQEWSCSKGSLRLCDEQTPITLADYEECKISLIQRSASTPPGGVTADLVVLDKGDDPAFYENLDLRGKLVLTDGDFAKVRKWAVEERGAIGIVSDRLAELPPIRHRFYLPDARQYTSFWWTGCETKCFGFVLSPRLGDLLRKKAAKAAPGYIRLHAEVAAEFYDGTIENVEALIPGQTKEEILLVAHLCHPQPSANDNASGAGVALEVARALQELISSGRLPRPKRSIRFLLVPEMTGTYAYLATSPERIPLTLAALNLDMVGAKPEQCKGPLVAEYPPLAADSFVGDLLAAILDNVAQEVTNLAGTGTYSLINYTAAPFSGGSDHYILSDPSVNIPCPMLIQWPDKHYHTSDDTIDKIDPEMLYRVGIISAAYAYFLANLDAVQALMLLQLCSRSYNSRLLNLLGSAISQEITPDRAQVDFLLERQCRQLESLGRFCKDERFLAELSHTLSHLQSLTELEWERACAIATQLGAQVPPSAERQHASVAGSLVPVRVYPGPVSLRGHLERLSPAEQEKYEGLASNHGADALKTRTEALYWCDGKRTIAEISNLVSLSLGHTNMEFIVDYFTWLSKMNLVQFA